MGHYPAAELHYGVLVFDPDSIYFQGFDDEYDYEKEAYRYPGLPWLERCKVDGYVQHDKIEEAIEETLREHGIWVGLEFVYGGDTTSEYQSTFLSALEAEKNSHGGYGTYRTEIPKDIYGANARIKMALDKLGVTMKLGYEPGWHLLATY